MISNSDIDNDLSLAGKEKLQHFPLEENPMSREKKKKKTTLFSKSNGDSLLERYPTLGILLWK